MAGHDRETRDGKWFFKQIEELKKLQARAGFQHGREKAWKRTGKGGKKIIEAEADIADVAMWNELGTARSKPRPFLRQSVDNNTDQIKAMCSAQLNLLAKGTATAKDVLQALGALQVGLIQKTIRDGDFEPNRPSTIKRKGSDRPLIDTGRMRQSVHYVIEEKE